MRVAGLYAAVFLVICSLPSFSAEVEQAIKHLQAGEKPSEQEREFWQKTYEQWRDSESSSKYHGNPNIGRALQKLSDGEMPDEQDTTAVLGLYNNTLSQEYTGTSPVENYQPQEAPENSHGPQKSFTIRIYAGIIAGFIIAIVIPVVLSRIFKKPV